MIERGDAAALGLAERIIAVLDRGSFNATYKYAVLLALLDLALEGTSASGAPPESVTTVQLAEKVISLYWSQAFPFTKASGVLKQNAGRSTAQAKIVRLIEGFRKGAADRFAGIERARRTDPEGYCTLLNRVEWVLIEMPLPKLQRVGTSSEPFLYFIGWNDGDNPPSQRAVARYQRGEPMQFDNRLTLAPGAGAALVRLNAMLRPLIHREWATLVAQLNRLPSAELEDFLFGVERSVPKRLRGDLTDLQDNCCFYCGAKLRSSGQVDHFIPWSRHQSDRIENLVVSDARCNGAKSDHLAAAAHLLEWRLRLEKADLEAMATKRRWPSDKGAAQGVASAIYRGLGLDVPLWQHGREFEPSDPETIASALGDGPENAGTE